MKCEDIRSAIKNYEEVIKEIKKFNERTERAMDVLEDLKPRSKKLLQDLKKLGESFDIKLWQGRSLEELIKSWEQAKGILQKQYEQECAWNGEISCKISEEPPNIPYGILKKFSHNEQHKWEIAGKPLVQPQGDKYPVSWSATLSYEYEIYSNDDLASTKTEITSGQVKKKPSSITIKIVGDNYEIMVPSKDLETMLSAHAENANTVKETITFEDGTNSTVVVKGVLNGRSLVIKGQLEGNEQAIAGTEGPIPADDLANFAAISLHHNQMITIVWNLTRKRVAPIKNRPKRKPSKKPGPLKQPPL